ncbi:MAG: ribonuclease R [Monoglobales bacterium]
MNRKEKISAYLRSKSYIPLVPQELAVLLDVPKEDMTEFENILDELVEDGIAVKTKKGRIMPSAAQNLITGTFQGSERGFGFVISDQSEKDVFIPADFINGAMNGDIVLIKVMSEGSDEKRPEGKVLKVKERANKEIVCTINKRFKGLEAIADNKKIWHRIKIPYGKSMGAKKGEKVVVEITSYPTESKSAEGKVIEIIGKADTPETARRSVMITYGLPEDFPENVLKEAEAIPETVPESALNDRRDLRDKIIFTIDGADAKDLDDAVSLETDKDGNYLLGVHIADVTHYVKEGSAINAEAIKRGTSVYLAGSVVPMLPRRLSNGICSLNGGVDRLTLSVEMTVNPQGEIISHDIFESVINTTERMTYDDIFALLSGDEKLAERYKNILPTVKNMKNLADIFRSRRMKNGSIDFNFPETKIIFDEDGNVTDIKKYEYTIANIIIEEFMLAANRTVAEHFYWLETPFVYRNHEQPSEEKLIPFLNLCSIFNILVKEKAENIHPKTLQLILEKVKGSTLEPIIANTMLRSMMKARYSTDNLGHFGLNEKYYCHFTSPIRRLADLAIHRIIKSYLHGKNKDYSDFASLAVKNATDMEIIAEEAENLSKKIITAQFMYDYVGEEFEATIVSITQSAFFVELNNSVQGRVALSDLHDYYVYNENTYSLVSGSKEYKMGDRVNVVLVRSDKISGEIDFIPSDEI